MSVERHSPQAPASSRPVGLDIGLAADDIVEVGDDEVFGPVDRLPLDATPARPIMRPGPARRRPPPPLPEIPSDEERARIEAESGAHWIVLVAPAPSSRPVTPAPAGALFRGIRVDVDPAEWTREEMIAAREEILAARQRDQLSKELAVGFENSGVAPEMLGASSEREAMARAWRGARYVVEKRGGDVDAIERDPAGWPIVLDRKGRPIARPLLMRVLPKGVSGHPGAKPKRTILELARQRLRSMAEQANEQARAQGRPEPYSRGEEEALIADAWVAMIVSGRSVPALKEYLDRTMGPVVQRVEANVGVRDLVKKEHELFLRSNRRAIGRGDDEELEDAEFVEQDEESGQDEGGGSTDADA